MEAKFTPIEENGHRPASDCTQAKTIDVAHELIKKGDSCPSCDKGKLLISPRESCFGS